MEDKRRVQVAVFLTMDFEEMEAISVIDVLRRGGVKVDIVSLANTLEVKGSHDIKIKADMLYYDIKEEDKKFYHALVLVGGSGTKNYTLNTNFLKWVADHYMTGGLLCAICAAPALLAEMGFTKGKHVTCYPTFAIHMQNAGAIVHSDRVVRDGNLLTGNGPGASLHFALGILEVLSRPIDPTLTNRVADQMIMNETKGILKTEEEKEEEETSWEINK